MRAGCSRRILEFRNKANKIKIQLRDGEFHAFSHVLEAEQCKKSLRTGNLELWHFWPESKVAIHRISYNALSSAMSEGRTLVWKYDDKEDELLAVEVHVDDEVNCERAIEDFANAALEAMDANQSTSDARTDAMKGSANGHFSGSLD